MKLYENNAFIPGISGSRKIRKKTCIVFQSSEKHWTESQDTQFLMPSVCPWANFIPSCALGAFCSVTGKPKTSKVKSTVYLRNSEEK